MPRDIAAGLNTLDVQLSPSQIMLSGDVIGTSGQKYSGAYVELVGTSFHTTSGPTGHYQFSDIPTGTYTLQCTLSGYYMLPTVPVYLTPGEVQTENIIMVLYPANYAKRVLVTLHERAGASYNDYPTLIDIAWNSNIKNDFSDVYFTELDDTFAHFGLVSKTNGSVARVVMVRDYIAGTSQQFYIYYGYPGAYPSNDADYRPWIVNWYRANGFGGISASYTDQVCSKMPHSISGVIPAWATDIAYISGVDHASAGVYGGRSLLNGISIPWSSGGMCAMASFHLDSYLKMSVNDQSLNHPAWIKGGGLNTIQFGHFELSNSSPRVGWLPQGMCASDMASYLEFGPEEDIL